MYSKMLIDMLKGGAIQTITTTFLNTFNNAAFPANSPTPENATFINYKYLILIDPYSDHVENE